MLVALPVYGLSTLMSTLLGAVHFHQPPTEAVAVLEGMVGWQDFRRVHHVGDAVFQVHDHAKLGRHHHEARDPGLVIVGAGENDDGAEGSASNAVPALALATSGEVALPSRAVRLATSAWHRPAICHFQSCDARRLDRPPIV